MYYRGEQTSINLWIVAFLIVIAMIMISFFITEICKPAIDQEYGTIRMAGYVKAAITFVKYMP